MASLPSNVNYGTVVGRFLIAKADSSDIDLFPDGAAAKGSVFFTPSVRKLLNLNAGGDPVTIIPATYEASLDSEGYLLGDDGTRGLRLVATDDPDLNPTGWTWNVSYRLTDENDIPITGIPDFAMELPTDGEVDLTLVTPVSEANGTYYLVGPTGPTGPQADLSNIMAADPLVWSLENAEFQFNWTNTVLDDLGDVDFTTLADGDMVKYNSTTSKWENTNILDGGTA